jgi:hypothetical protein
LWRRSRVINVLRFSGEFFKKTKSENHGFFSRKVSYARSEIYFFWGHLNLFKGNRVGVDFRASPAISSISEKFKGVRLGKPPQLREQCGQGLFSMTRRSSSGKSESPPISIKAEKRRAVSAQERLVGFY